MSGFLFVGRVMEATESTNGAWGTTSELPGNEQFHNLVRARLADPSSVSAVALLTVEAVAKDVDDT